MRQAITPVLLLVVLLATVACGGNSDAKSNGSTATNSAANQGEIGPVMLLSIAARSLKMSDSELQTEVQKGKSLSAIAREHGVGRDVLKQAILDQLRASTQQAGDAVNLNAMIDALLDQAGGPLSPPPNLTPVAPGGLPSTPPVGAPPFRGTPPSGLPPIIGTPPAGFPPLGGTPPAGLPPLGTPPPTRP